MRPLREKAFLVLQNGRVFAGERFGAVGDVTAEIVFATGTTGYLETLTASCATLLRTSAAAANLTIIFGKAAWPDLPEWIRAR